MASRVVWQIRDLQALAMAVLGNFFILARFLWKVFQLYRAGTASFTSLALLWEVAISLAAYAVLFVVVRKYVAGGQCTYRTDLSDKVAIITGANTGLGLVNVELLAQMGCRVIMACRSRERAEIGLQYLKSHLTPEQFNKVEFMQLDLASFKSIKQFVEAFKARQLPCHILVNNAGVMMCPYSKTEDGFETQFGTNHLGHFYLTTLLMPILINSKARIVNLSSEAHMFAKPYVDYEQAARPTPAQYNPTVAYGNSKLANILFTKELQKRYGEKINAYAAHPGAVTTELSRYSNQFLQLLFTPILAMGFKIPMEGVQTQLYCAIHPEAKPGQFHTDCTAVDPVVKEASDEARAAQLWEFSEAICRKFESGQH